MKQKFSIEEEIFINQFLQDLFSLEKMNEWFEKNDESEKRNILHNLYYMFIQSHPTYEEIEDVVQLLNKSRSPTAIKLLNRRKPFAKFGYEVCALHKNEQKVTFNILLLTLKKADMRRKIQECSNGCNHWWHKDLSDEKYLQNLRKMRIENSNAFRYDPKTKTFIKEE